MRERERAPRGERATSSPEVLRDKRMHDFPEDARVRVERELGRTALDGSRRQEPRDRAAEQLGRAALRDSRPSNDERER